MTVALETRPAWEGLRESGADSVEFLLAANPGQPPRSLARTASGGELSRVLLGLKCALAGAGGDETLVFDEIDAGIGGRTAVAVAQKLRELADRSQVVVVTHLAHVAALAEPPLRHREEQRRRRGRHPPRPPGGRRRRGRTLPHDGRKSRRRRGHGPRKGLAGQGPRKLVRNETSAVGPPWQRP